MNNEVLIYGAGNNAKKLWGNNSSLDTELSNVWKNTVAFIDSDQRKQDTMFLGKPVLSIEDGLKRYPDAFIYISIWYTEDIYRNIFENLTNYGVNYEKFINCRRTCEYLEKFLVCGYHESAFSGKAGRDAGAHSLKPCCSDYGKNQVDHILINDNLEYAFEHYLKLRDSLLEKVYAGIDSCCTGCPLIKFTNQKVNKGFSYIIFNEMGRCNCKCIYCNYEERLGRDVSQDIDVLELYRLICEYGYDVDNGVIELCNGEITIHPDKKRIYGGLKNTNIMFLTNGLIYDEEIARRMQNGTAILNISIDSGTRETFKEVKGIDGFDKVVRNLSKYADKKKGKIYLKYILLPGVNDKDKDIKGFVQLCKEINADMAHISYNLAQDFVDYDNPQMIKTVKLMIRLLQDNNISYEIYSKGVLEKLLES